MPESEDKTRLAPEAAPSKPAAPGRSHALEDALLELTGREASAGTHALSTFLENSPDPVVIFNEAGDIIAKNQRAAQLWDGKDDFIPSQLVNEVRKVGASGSLFHGEKKNHLIVIEAHDGRRYFLPTMFRLCENGNRSETALCHRAIACILKDETIWERSERIRKNLFASISHELNTPLTSARLALYLLAEQQIGQLNDNQRDLVDRAKQDLDREIISIQNIIDMIRADGIGQQASETEELNLHELIEETISDFEDQIKAMQLPVKRDYSSASPWILIERDTAKLVMHQLFTSIFKYTGEGAKLTIITVIEDGHCLLELITENDEQVDFPPEDIFTLEMESDRARQLRCADLGLRVAHEMIVPYGGTLNSQREANAGKLHFRFPRLKR